GAQTAFAGSFGESLHTAVVNECTTVEHYFADACFNSTLSNQLTNRSGCCGVGTGLELALQVAIQGRSSGDGNTANVVDNLNVDVLGRAVHAETRTAVCNSLDLTAYTSSATLQSFFWRCHDALPLLLLAFFADDLLASILDALALVRLGAAIFADLSRDLTDLLLVDTGDDDFRRLRNGNSDASRHVIDHFVA